MKIYIVEGHTGEYEDAHNWIVRAFVDESKAEAFLNTLLEKTKELGIARWPTSKLVDAAYEQMIALDPTYHCDYTGVDYSMYDLEVEE